MKYSITNRIASLLAILLLTGTSALADTSITSGNTFTINNDYTTVVGDLTTWNEAGTLTIESGGTLLTVPSQNKTVANNAAIVLAGSGGTITMKVNGNDTDFQMNGAITSTATGPLSLNVYTGVSNAGDRESVTFNSGIPDANGSDNLSLNVIFNAFYNSNWVNLNAVNTFNGPIALSKIGDTVSGTLTIGGTLTRYNGNTLGTGTLNSGDYAGAITLGTGTTLNYASSATQTLSGAISGAGALKVTGTGLLTLSGINTYSGNTTVGSGDSLALADNAGMTFYVTNSTSNKITGPGSATLDGDFTIDTSAVTASTGTWVLVDTTTKSFTSNFSVAGAGWSETSDVWSKVDGTYTWTFTEADGTLRISAAGIFTSFGIPGYAGVIDNNLNTIKLLVPKGTDFATLAPEFTLASGTCDQTSGAVPSPTFAAANPVTYTVTDPAISSVRNYAVTVSFASGIINVSIEKSGSASNPAQLTGPAGGLGETWNQITTVSASGLSDSTGAATTIGFTGTPDAYDQWGSPDLQMLWTGLRVFATGSAIQMTINGLTTGDFYDVYLASANVASGQRSKGSWSTANSTSTVGTQPVDNTGDLNTTSWAEGNNYVLLENVVVDGDGKIILNGQAAATFRLPFNGFQLVPRDKASITSFGIAGAVGVINQNAKTIALEVPFGTNLATLAPVFTLNSGTANQISGSPPSPTFAAQNPVTYTVTDGATVNDYTVTVSMLPDTTTYVINLGTSPAGTTIVGGEFGKYGIVNLPSLPPGSILRSITAESVKLEASDAENLASDLTFLVDPTPGTPGGDFSLEVTNGTSFGATKALGWANGDNGVGTVLDDTKTDGDWASLGAIDLSTSGIFLGNAFGATPDGGTWSGTITLTYDLVVGGSDYDTWAAGFLPDDVSNPNTDFDGDGMSNSQERTFGLNPTSGASVNPITVPLNPTAGTLSYTRRDPALTGLVYTVWTSSDLVNWTMDAAASSGQVPSAADMNQVQTVAVTLSATPVNGKLFVQIRAN